MLKRRRFLYATSLLTTLSVRGDPATTSGLTKNTHAFSTRSANASLARNIHILNNRVNQFAKSVDTKLESTNFDLDALCHAVFSRPHAAVTNEPYSSLYERFIKKRIEDHNHLGYRIENNFLLTYSEVALLQLASCLNPSEQSIEKRFQAIPHNDL